MLGVYIRIINVLNFHEYKYESDIIKEARVHKGTIRIYLSQLEALGYIERKEDKPGEGFLFPRYKYKLSEKGLRRKIELGKKPTSYIGELVPEPN